MSQVFISYRQTDDEQTTARARLWRASAQTAASTLSSISSFLMKIQVVQMKAGLNGAATARSRRNTFSSSALKRGSSASRRRNHREPDSALPAKPTIFASASTKRAA